jgi:1,4-alpha-glucan branching enzyme
MKKVCVVFLCAIGIFLDHSNAQLLATTPDFPTDNSSLTITLDATKGNKALQGFTGNVFLHTGVITNLSTTPSDWKYVQGTWATATAPQATAAGTNKWSINIPNIRDFYKVPLGEQILKITILFRNQAGTVVQRNLDGSDMYINVYEQGAFAAKFTEPFMQPMFIPIPEPIASNVSSVNVRVVTSQNSTTTIKFNNNILLPANATGTSTSRTANVNTECEQFLSYETTAGSITLRDTVSFFKNPATYPTGARPAGLRDGITFQDNNTSAVFILYAPLKQKVQLVGDFNNWIQTCSGLMTRETDANGNFYYWTKVTGLTPGQSYRFQYIVEDSIRFADPYSPLVLDPNNDRWIPKVAYPNIPEYPTGKTSGDYVGVITPGETPFNWTDQGYTRPNKYNLMIYELHMRDFLRNESWQSLIDTLPYLINLGFNAIKVMPFNEFDGNNSWGYNPCYFFAPDKAYGPKEKLKQFINEAHRNGIAVIMDVAFNHASGQSPLAKMWWNSAASKPAANNPYFYTDARHPFNVYNDFNHNTAPTRNHVERFIEYWLTEYKIDGFRWDLSKGFTPNDYPCGATDQGCWDAFRQGRIDIWQNYYNKMQAVSGRSYCILEHLSVDAEEYELVARGMLVWGKMNAEFNENTMGTNGNKDIGRAYWRNRWQNDFINDKPGLIAYAESHDEERIMFRNRTFGNVAFRSFGTALPRTEAMAAIFMAIPGPKMIWQFGELGYEFSITACPPNPYDPLGTWTTPTGTAYNPGGGCRTDRKPIRWNYFYNTTEANVPARRKIYFLYASMAKLRKQFPDAFNRTTLVQGTWFANDLYKAVVVDQNPTLPTSFKMVVVANFEGAQITRNDQPFPSNGIWYDYINGGTINVTNNRANITLPAASATASSYRVFINQQVNPVTNVENLPAVQNTLPLSVYPNPLSDLSVVKYSLPKSGRVQMQLLNLQGQVLLSKNMGFQLKGDQIVSLFDNGMNTDRLSTGTYLLQLVVDNEVKVEKVTIQR